MNKTVKRSLILVPTLAIAGMLAAGATMASGWGGHDGWGHKGGNHNSGHMSKGSMGQKGAMMGRHMAKKLDLTDAQQDAMKDIMQAQRQGSKGGREAMAAQMSELAKLESGSAAYIAKAQAIGEMQGEAMTQRLISMASIEQQILSLLTPEQAETYQTLRAERAEHMAERMQNYGNKGDHSS